MNLIRRGPLNEIPWRHVLIDPRIGRSYVEISEELLSSHRANASVICTRARLGLDFGEAHWLQREVRKLVRAEGAEPTTRSIRRDGSKSKRLTLSDDRQLSGFVTLSEERFRLRHDQEKVVDVTSALDFAEDELKWLLGALDVALDSEPRKRRAAS
jgi:hypothetical protein